MNTGRGTRSGVSAYEARRATSSPSRSTRYVVPKASGVAVDRTVNGPPRTAEWTPAPALTRSTPSALTRCTWISPVSRSAASAPAAAEISTSSAPTSSTARTWSVPPVRSRSPTARTRAPPSSVIRTSFPSGVHAGEPPRSSTQSGSSSACTIRVAPLSSSTPR
ncbi:hypothetical protein GA0115246_104973 [Streptomyces sp. SolWspMP-sol7th]|nr:hypothetical protein GA0115246_104973 [Streptomyces sp. SolWspMP-sol7th]